MAVNRAIPNLPPGLVNGLLFFAVVIAGVGYIIVSKLNGFGALAVTAVPVLVMIGYAVLLAARPFRLYFYEVDLGSQPRGFHPTDYIDSGAVREKKKAALFAHKSQNGEEIYRRHHEVIEADADVDPIRVRPARGRRGDSPSGAGPSRFRRRAPGRRH